jgi:hypothetical protein
MLPQGTSCIIARATNLAREHGITARARIILKYHVRARQDNNTLGGIGHVLAHFSVSLETR